MVRIEDIICLDVSFNSTNANVITQIFINMVESKYLMSLFLNKQSG